MKTTNSLGIEMTSSSGNLVSQRHLVDSAEHCWESKVNVRRLQGEILQYSSSHIVLILRDRVWKLAVISSLLPQKEKKTFRTYISISLGDLAQW